MIRVLIVDDHEVVRQGLRYMLEQRPDFEVVGEGSDGEEAIALVNDLLPDVVLLDLLMPRVDGWDFLKIRKQDPALRGIPVIVVTGVSIASDEWAQAAGASGCLKKPVDVDELIDRIEHSLPA